jgi:hypothetical protein
MEDICRTLAWIEMYLVEADYQRVPGNVATEVPSANGHARRRTAMQDKLIDLRKNGYCVLKQRFASPLIATSREAFWPALLQYLDVHGNEPNRGSNRHYVPMPFEPPCFEPEYFFDADVLSIVRSLMGDRVVADQWGCDVALQGSDYQGIHVDYRHPLFSELPDLSLPVYMVVVSFGLEPITMRDGPIEIAPGTQDMPRNQALHAAESGEIEMQPIPMEIGDVLIRHPWTMHRGSPNSSVTPRALVSISLGKYLPRLLSARLAHKSPRVSCAIDSIGRLCPPDQAFTR